MSRSEPLERLHRAAPLVLPSLLLCDFGDLRSEVERLEAAGVQGLHLDVMDGHFVPNLTYGMPIVEAVRKLTDLPLDVHLMIRNPGRYLATFREAGADVITIHAEVTEDPRPLLQEIRRLGAGSGLAMEIGTPVSQIQACLDLCDLVLVMSVATGFGGQSFNPFALEKLRQLRASAEGDLLLEVDGGVNAATISRCAEAGADLLVAGSAIFRQPDYGVAVSRLQALTQSH
jgi:ribulose-phosphate 3-epimerase